MGMKAKVDTQFTHRLRKTFKLSIKDNHTLAANILLQFIYAFKHHLWKPRCAQFNLDEKAQGISNNIKRSTATATNSPIPSTLATQTDHPPNNRPHTTHTV